MTDNPQMTVKQLMEALTKAVAKEGSIVLDMPVTIWLPGSKIDLACVMGIMPNVAPGELLIEGNLREGSALCRD